MLLLRVAGISAVPHEENLRYFDVKIHGPSQSPYEGQSMELLLPQVADSSRRYIQTRALPARRLSDDATQDTLSYQDIPSEH